MSACCVSGCKNRHSSTCKLKLYRIPSGCRPFQANRRRLWLEAIRQVNGGAEELKGNARICGAHFISGEASMDHDSPDFVPSLFTCSTQSPSPRRKGKWFYGRRKRRRRTANVETEEKTTPRVDSPEEHQSSILMEEISVPKEEETLTKEPETETKTKTINFQTTSSPNKASPSFKAPAGILKLDNRIPIVLLKSVFAPASGYQCERCNQNFTNVSQLVKHKQLHEEERSFICEICEKLFTSQADFTEHQRVHEPSFTCNMCDRSFTTSQNLKRHKLLHVKDGRKCHKCGVLFCQRHNHVAFLPQAESIKEFEQDCFISEPQNFGSKLMPENDPLEKPEPMQTVDLDDDAQSSISVKPLLTTTTQTVRPAPPNTGPLSNTTNDLPPASHTRILSEIPIPLLVKPVFLPRPPRPVRSYSTKQGNSSQFTVPDYSAAFLQPQLPSSLKIFSPQYLTSALLKVKRNYEYIFSKPRDVKNKRVIVKEEQCEHLLICPDVQNAEHNKKDGTAYDLEVML